MYTQLICCFVGSFLILFSSFWFRTQLRDIYSTEKFREPFYDEIVLLFLDATGYRYVMNQGKDHQIFQAISILKTAQLVEPQNSFFQKTKAVPPSTDFTILSIINGIKQMQNNLDVTFKSNPAPYEDSMLRKKMKSSLYSSKKQDWLRMTSGDFSYIENPQFFSVDNIKIADISSYTYFKNDFLQKKYQFYVLHMMGFDALGHALQYQNYDQGIELLKMFNQIIEGTLALIQDRQLLIVIGDHDQSKRGKHYQCSAESYECEGFIFAYTPTGLHNNAPFYSIYEPTDLSATISALLGYLPTSQNAGKIIPQLYPYNTPQEIINQDQEMIKAQVLQYLEKLGSQISDNLKEEIKQLPASEAVAQVQRNLQIGMPSKSQFTIGLVILFWGLASFRQYWGFRDIVLISITGMLGKSFLIAGIISKIALKFKEFTVINILQIVGVLLILQLNQLNMIPELCYSFEFQFILILVIKYWHIKEIGQILNWKVFILLIFAVLSQILVFVFFILEQSDFDLKRAILSSLIVLLVFFCLIDPRFFNKGRVKVLYLTIVFIFSDITVIFQLNNSRNFIQFLLFFVGMQISNTPINVILAKIIYNTYNPIMIEHQIFKGSQMVNMNSMIILTQEFEIGSSLFSVFIGNFGLQLTGIATLLFNKEIKDTIQTISAIIFLCVGKLLQDSWQILNYTQSIHNSNEEIEYQIAKINGLPLKLVELILYSFAMLLILKRLKSDIQFKK